MQPWRQDPVLERRQSAAGERFGRDHLRDGGPSFIRTGRPGRESALPESDNERAAGRLALQILAATAGVSTLLTIGGVGVLLSSAQGPCVNPADQSANWSIAPAGETVLSVAS